MYWFIIHFKGNCLFVMFLSPVKEIWGDQSCAPLPPLISIVVSQTCHWCYISLKYQEIIQWRIQVVTILIFYFFKIISTLFSGLDKLNQ